MTIEEVEAYNDVRGPSDPTEQEISDRTAAIRANWSTQQTMERQCSLDWVVLARLTAL
jgi:hypothetical protein